MMGKAFRLEVKSEFVCQMDMVSRGWIDPDFFRSDLESPAPQASAPTPAEHRGDPELQQKRLAFMNNAIELGLIAKIEDDGPITHVLTGQRFLSLSFEEKEEILNVVWAYYKTEDPQKNVVLVIEQSSGKELGEYSPANGGLKMK